MSKGILGVGQILWDLTASVDYSFLKDQGIDVGEHRLIKKKDIENIIEQLQNHHATIRGEILKNPGGSAANVMSNMAKLGHKTSFYGKHGNDEDGYSYMKILAAEGVTPYSIVDNEHSTGQLFSLLTPDKDRTFLVYWGASESLPPELVDKNLIASFEIVHLEGYLIVNSRETLWKIGEHAKQTTFDLAAASIITKERAILQKMLMEFHPRVLFANFSEGVAFTRKKHKQDIIERMLDFSDTAVLTLGEEGVLVRTTSGEEHFEKAIPTMVADTTGAGDAFCAGFLNHFLQHKGIREAAKLGVKVASVTISKIGARSFQMQQLR